MQRPVPDAQAPDVMGSRVLDPEAVRGGNHIVADGPGATLDVDGHDFAVVVGLDLRTNLPLVYRVTQAGRLFFRAIRGRGRPIRLRGRRGFGVPHNIPVQSIPLQN